MCGIIGYVGDREAVPIIMNGLSKLEYRGYDSSGVAVISDGKLSVAKKVGKLIGLQEELDRAPIYGKIGIGHTRWATHGKPLEKNAHPHVDCSGKFAVVHNGIIENFLELRQMLLEEGHSFNSDTDTEVIVHLWEKFYQGDPEAAFEQVIPLLKGSYAIVAVCVDAPEKIFFARNESPLIIGVGKNEYFAASDVPAFLSYAREIILIENQEYGYITADSVVIKDLSGTYVNRRSSMVTWNSDMAEKSGFKHFMLKEIYEQPRSIANTLAGTLGDEEIILDEASLDSEVVKKIKRISIVACGTAYHAGMLGKYFIEQIVGIPVDIDVASEFRYRNPVISDETLFIAVSQSGETADTLAAVKEAHSKGARTLAVTNVVGSSITRVVDGVIYTRAGLEMGVAATKTFTAQTLIMYLIALYLAQKKGVMAPDELSIHLRELRALPKVIAKQLQNLDEIKFVARTFQGCRDFLFLGRNVNYPLALEGALKLKEISYIHAEGYAAGEMKHGPIALVDKNCPIVAVMTNNSVHDKMIGNIQEVMARDASVIGISTEGDPASEKLLTYALPIPKMNPYISTISAALPLQLLSYYIADVKGRDVDKPRNLAKSVTVE